MEKQTFNQNPVLDNRKKLEKAYQEYRHRIYDFAIRMLGDKDMAADTVQESYMRFYNALENGDSIRNPQSWLYTSVRNRCLNIIRDNRKFTEIDSAAGMPDQSASGNDDKRRIRNSLRKLDIKHREALVLREYHSLSYEEMAEVLGISRAGVRSLLYKARLALRKVYFEINDARIKS